MEESDEFDSKIIFNTSSTKTIDSLWILNGFSNIKENTYKTSPMFPCSEENNKWSVKLEEYTDGDGFFISLKPVDTFDQDGITVDCTYSILNSENASVLSYQADRRPLKKPFNWDIYWFIKSSELRKYVKNDKLKIQTIFTTDFLPNYLCKTQYENIYPVDVLINDFRSMLSNSDFCDFLFKVEDKEIPVHKVVVAARSPVFEAMIKNDMLEAKQGFVKITDSGKNTISALVKYMYGFNVDIENDEDAKQLLVAADKYGLLHFKQLCEDYLIDNCNVSKFFDSLVFAEENNAEHLKKGLLNYIAKNKHLFKNLKSLKISNSFSNLIKDLISVVLCE